MKVRIRKIAEKEAEQVIIECVEITSEVKDICAYAGAKGRELVGTENGKSYRFPLASVYYFEALDEKVFAYTSDRVYEIRLRLYEAEEAYTAYHFIRCSKSVLLNLMQLESISPALNGRFFAHMKNGETVMISRAYVPKLKEAVMGEEGKRL